MCFNFSSFAFYRYYRTFIAASGDKMFGETILRGISLLLAISYSTSQDVPLNSTYSTYSEPLGRPLAQYGYNDINQPKSYDPYGSTYGTSARTPFGSYSPTAELGLNNPFYDATNSLGSGRNTYESNTGGLGGLGGPGGLGGLGGTFGVSGFTPDINLLDENKFCPEFWIAHRQTCYRFIKSPKRSYYDAKKICQAYKADLINVDNVDKHSFVLKELIVQDQKQNRYYLSARQISPNSWTNDDGSPLVAVDDGFAFEETDFDADAIQENLAETNRYYNRFDPLVRRDQNPLYYYEKTRLVYGYSRQKDRWLFIPVYDFEHHLFICESRQLYDPNNLNILQDDTRGFDYGLDITTEYAKIPRGPYFFNQPNDTTFDTGKRKIRNDVTISCYAAGYPTPTYSWYKEEYVNDNLTYHKIDPLEDSRFTISGGSLIIYNPNQTIDQGTYHCIAENKFGRVRSESVDLNFGYIMEFNLKRSGEAGKSNWGHALFCDPPQRKYCKMSS